MLSAASAQSFHLEKTVHKKLRHEPRPLSRQIFAGENKASKVGPCLAVGKILMVTMWMGFWELSRATTTQIHIIVRRLGIF